MSDLKYGELPRLVRAALAEYERINIKEFAEAEFPYHSYQEINSVIQRIARLGELQRISRGVYKVVALYSSYRVDKRNNRKITEELIDTILRLYANGWSQREISAKLKISRKAIRTTIVQDGMRVRSRNEQRYVTTRRNLKIPKQLTLDI